MTCSNPIILGGAGSSGSTLLVSILNRHKEIAAGPELSLLNKKYFFNSSFEKIRKNAKKIVEKGVCTDGWFIYPHFFFNKYGFSNDEIKTLFRHSKSQFEFIDGFFSQYLERQNKTIWAEKTPSNSYCFKDMLEIYPGARIIHLYRDGRDVITSFIRRGMTVHYATMLWLYNSSMALAIRDHPNYYELKYEDLVNDPEGEVRKLCSFLRIDYDNEMVLPEEGPGDVVESWNHSPNSSINSSSVGKYKHFLKKFHYYVFDRCSISGKHIKEHQLKHPDAKAIQDELGYQDKSEIAKMPGLITRTWFFLRLTLLQLKDITYRYYMFFKYRKKPPPYPARIRF